MPIRAREQEDIDGCVALLREVHEDSGYPSAWPEDPGGWLFIAPSARRQGLARLLLKDAVSCAKERGLYPILDVAASSRAAAALYERSGWRLVGTETATWTTPTGLSPKLRCYVGPLGDVPVESVPAGKRYASWVRGACRKAPRTRGRIAQW